MATLFSCVKGHRWQNGTGDSVADLLLGSSCPVCGAKPVSSPASPPASSDSFSGPGEQTLFRPASTDGDISLEPAPPASDHEETLVRAAPSSQSHGDAGSATDHPADFPSGSHCETLPPEMNRPRAELPARGALVPGYEILGVLGRGGMGVVYKARHLQLNRVVALKMILSGEHAGPNELARFRGEAEAVARFEHPNIVRIYEVGEQAGRPYFSLEYIGGGSLQQRLAETPLRFHEAAELVFKIADAIHYAHGRGIVHRDLKPANILIDEAGEPKITDFGLAKRIEGDAGQTGTGAVLGTPAYMAPEQAEGRNRDIGPPADIYSLGSILYDLLTGRPPFVGETLLDTLQQVQKSEPVPPVRLQPKVPRDLQTICLKCLEKAPEKRYASAGALADDLHCFLSHRPISARPTPAWERAWKWAVRRPTLAALVAVSTAAGLLLAVGGPLVAHHQYELRHEADEQRDIARSQEQLANERLDEVRKEKHRADVNFMQARTAVDQMLSRLADERLVDEPRLEKVRRDLILKARDFYENYREQVARDPAFQAEAAQTYARLGDIQADLGATAEAVKAYRAAADLYRALAKRSPSETAPRSQLAGVSSHLSVVLAAANQVSEADQAHAEALALLNTLAKEHPDQPALRRQLGEMHNDWALQLQAANRTPEARAELRSALALYDGLVKEAPASAAYQLQRIKVEDNLAALLTSTDPAEAERLYRDALAGATRLAEQRPEAPEHARELGRTCSNLAVLLQLTRRPDEAEKVYRQAGDTFDRLARDFPSMPDYRHQRAVNGTNLGNLLNASKRPAEAERSWEQARDLLRKLADEFPTTPVYRQDLARNWNDFGIYLASAGRSREAEQAWDKALEIQRRLLADTPGNAAYRQELARSLGNLGILQARMGRFTEAEENYNRAITLLQELEARYPNTAAYWQELAVPETNLALLLRALARAQEAEKHWRRAVAWQRKSTAAAPKSSEARAGLAVSLAAFADFLKDRTKTDEARTIQREALDNQKVALDQADAVTRPAQGIRLLDLAAGLVALGDADAAAAAVIDLAKKAPTEASTDVRSAGVLALCTAAPSASPDKSASYGEEAMRLLRRALTNGYKDVDHLKTSADFESLRNRTDFKKLLAHNGSR